MSWKLGTGRILTGGTSFYTNADIEDKELPAGNGVTVLDTLFKLVMKD